MAFIRNIALSGTVPTPYDVISGHNPLYHVLAAGVYKVAEWLGAANPFAAVRHLSLLLFLGFSVFGVVTLKRLFCISAYYYTALALFFCWPLGFVMPGKINDDLAVYFLVAGQYYYLTQWEESRCPHHLSVALLFCALLILTKGGGILHVAILAAVVTYRIITNDVTVVAIWNRRIAAATALTGVAAMAIGARAWSYGRYQKSVAWYVSTPADVPHNTIEHFVGLDYVSFFSEPFIGPFAPGREYFWNFFLKSLLFGEWTLWQMPEVARVIGVLLLSLLLYSGVGMLCGLACKRKRPGGLFVPTVTAVFLIAGLMYFRFRFPSVSGLIGPSNDARYVYNIILPLTILFVKAIEWHAWGGRKWLAALGIMTGLAFAGLSAVFQAVNAYAAFKALSP